MNKIKVVYGILLAIVAIVFGCAGWVFERFATANLKVATTALAKAEILLAEERRRKRAAYAQAIVDKFMSGHGRDGFKEDL